jgi:hypothetical protein
MLRLLKCKLSIRGLLSALNAKDVGNGQAESPCSVRFWEPISFFPVTGSVKAATPPLASSIRPTLLRTELVKHLVLTTILLAVSTNLAADEVDVEALLKAGDTKESLPANFVIRIEADLIHSPRSRIEAKNRGAKPNEELNEIWEFTSKEVHRVVIDKPSNNPVYRRVKSIPFDSKSLCKELLEAKLQVIELGEGKGDPLQFLGTPFDRGHRGIEVRVDNQVQVHVCETCFGAGYPASDARAFAKIYKRLATQARAAFQEHEASKK